MLFRSNLASRLESRAAPDTILASESTYWRLRPAFMFESEADMELKGIGLAKVYSLIAPREERLSDMITVLQPGKSAR